MEEDSLKSGSLGAFDFESDLKALRSSVHTSNRLVLDRLDKYVAIYG